MLKPVAAGFTAFCAAILCAAPFSVRVSPEASVWLSLDTAAARIGRPLTPMSIAGVHRRAMRRAYYGYGAYGLYGYGYGTNWPSSYYASHIRNVPAVELLRIRIRIVRAVELLRVGIWVIPAVALLRVPKQGVLPPLS
jgi:hypothetical protein